MGKTQQGILYACEDMYILLQDIRDDFNRWQDSMTISPRMSKSMKEYNQRIEKIIGEDADG